MKKLKSMLSMSRLLFLTSHFKSVGVSTARSAGRPTGRTTAQSTLLIFASCAMSAIFVQTAGLDLAFADSNELAALSWLPPSTSYLPLYRGPLVRQEGHGPSSEVESLLAKEIVSGSHLTVADRFDTIRANVLGHTTPVKEQMSKLTYRPEYNLLSGAWRGYCNRWSAWTSSDGALVKEVSQSSDLVCGGTFLSVGEIKELITLFYPDSPAPGRRPFPNFTGYRYSHPLDSTVLLARNHIGTDSLSVSDFDTQLFGQLRSDEGLVMNLSSPGQIWNYPVFRAEARVHPVVVSDLLGMTPLPAKVFTANTPNAKALLEAYDLTYQAVDTYTLMFDGKEETDSVDPETRQRTFSPLLNNNFIEKTLANRARLIPLVYEHARALGIPGYSYRTLNSDPAQGLSQLLDILYTDLVGQLDATNLNFNPAFEIVRKSTKVYYGKESPFASEQTSINFRTRTFDYVLYQSKDKNIKSGGAWSTPSTERPGFIWIANSYRNSKSANPYANLDALEIKGYDGLAEVWTLLHSCTAVTEVSAFFAKLKSTSTLNSPDGVKLRANYKRLKPVLNSSELLRTNAVIANELLKD